MSRKSVNDVFVIGFAMFAMFFGAGNLIFPPYLGLISGGNWGIGFICFMLMDMGLSIFTLVVVAKIGKGAEGITEVLGRIPSKVILAVNAICLGPVIAIPRTAATAYEFSIEPFFPDVSRVAFSLVFFSIVVLFCLKQSKVMDIIGMVFAPVIFAALVVLIVKGILNPIDTVAFSASLDSAIHSGTDAGYQTMDVMAAMILSSSIFFALRQKNYTEEKQQFHMILFSGALAALILAIVYGGLTYLGATASGIYGDDIDRASLLIAITETLLGKKGMVFLGGLVCAACITPAIGLLSSAASFFEKETRGKISYRTFVILFAGISCVFSNFGISRILKIASPILNIMYPVLIVLVIVGFIRSTFYTQKYIPFSASMCYNSFKYVK